MLVLLGAEARTVVNGDLCRGSCVGRARTGRTALSDHHAHRPATLVPSAGRAVQRPVAAACANVDSGSSAVARRDGRFWTGHTPAPTLAAGPFVPSGGVIGAGHAAAAWLHAAHWYGTAPGAPSRCSTRALRACRAAGTHGSVQAWKWDSERADRATLTRPTGCGRIADLAARAQQASIGADVRAARARPVGDPPGTLWVRPEALPSSHGPSRAKVAHEPGRRRRWVRSTAVDMAAVTSVSGRSQGRLFGALLLLIGCGSASAVSRDVTCAGVMRERRLWFDIGSNNGAYTNELLIRRPGMFERAFLFEPNPRFIRELNLLHARHPEARHVQKAAWITDGSITFHIGRNDEASSILKERSHVHANTKCASASEFDQRTAYAGNASSSQQIVRRWGARSICDVPRQVTVPSINVADFVERESCPHDKLSLKMDIEGAEHNRMGN